MRPGRITVVLIAGGLMSGGAPRAVVADVKRRPVVGEPLDVRGSFSAAAQSG